MKEFLCPYCKDWYDPAFCESHFSNTHNQSGVTFDRLQARTSMMGGLEVRDTDDVEPSTRVFETNNFTHHL